MVEERLLRFAAPELYQRMVETFSTYHLHPYDVQATIFKSEDGFDVTLRFSNDFSKSVTTYFKNEQAAHPDEAVTRFFEEAADKCKSTLIADYFKMIKV
ncbi:hypothetical protein [Neobacillus ginsengisoli]|uniref:Uncharacterized protein n=1 Tax=Neobacillus ginsengisoli TaxID=904295 RepID=A0ABT9XQE1_9BACI|nr:hypothetical protein [Neobacillus ginsengisoli]MDQ0197753.1 hypothetical protein [Neobacillus ginsengisoli]